jgi:hypothetical protein
MAALVWRGATDAGFHGIELGDAGEGVLGPAAARSKNLRRR